MKRELSQTEINVQIEQALEAYHNEIMSQYPTDEELYDYETKGQRVPQDDTDEGGLI